MDMTKFSSAKDAGYVAVSDQLWLWADTLKKTETQFMEEIREGRNKKFGTMQDVGSSVYSGSVNSGGGLVFQGNQSAGRDFNVNQGFR